MTGRLVVEGRYALTYLFSEGLGHVIRGDLVGRTCEGYVDASGNEVIPCIYKSASSFKDGLASVRRRGRKWRSRQLFIDRTGQVVLETGYPMVEPFSEGLAAAWNGSEFGYIDITGRMVVEPQFGSG